MDCGGLATLKIPASSIGEPSSGASVKSASVSDASDTNGSYCKVLGEIAPVDPTAPVINFEVNLPVNWNSKAIQMGGSGFNGTLVTGLDNYVNAPAASATPLKMGFVTLGSDSGHQSVRNKPFDATFALNDEALLNFGQLSIKKTRDVAVALIQSHYGKKASRFYFIGGSQGGSEAFLAAQRYPADYDGVIAGYPVYNKMLLMAGASSISKAMYQNGGIGWVSPQKADMLVKAVYAACDALDGLADGIIADVHGCQVATKKFKAKDASNPLRCPGGSDTAGTCLSDPQIDALNQMDSPASLGFTLYDDVSEFPKWTPFEGATFRDFPSPSPLPFMLGLANKPVGVFTAGMGPVSDEFEYGPGLAMTRYFITKDITTDPINGYRFTDWKDRILQLEPIINARDARLTGFQARGGKMILYHGRVDELVSPYNSIQYYERVVKANGQAATDKFLRFFMVPGMGHLAGPFPAQIDTLAALEKWIEQGIAPEEMIAGDGSAGATAGRTRPVCAYGKWPKYVGGDARLATSFACTAS